MTGQADTQVITGFSEVKSVLANPEKFKIKLGIGSDAYTSLKAAKTVSQIWDIGGAAGTGASVAASTTVASTFFGTFWSSVGLATAVTPIGWIVGAAVVSGGAYYGVIRLFKSYSGSRVEEVPKFLNTALDVLATSSFDLMGSLALKVASIDGHIASTELDAIHSYFVEEWGFDENYMRHALTVLSENIDRSRLSDMTKALADFATNNPDCNFDAVRNEIKNILTEVAEADGSLDEREEMAIERINSSLQEHASLTKSASRAISGTAKSVGDLANSTANNLHATVSGFASKIFGNKS